MTEKKARSMAGLPWIAAMAFFMQALDATILNTALPAIAQSLDRSPLAMQSAIISYTLTVAMLIPASGWLADRFGKHDRRHVVTAPAIGMALAVPIAMSAYFMTDWRLGLLLLMVPTVLNSLYYGPVFASTQGLVALRHRAMASAVLLFCQNLIGLGLGPLFFGMLSDFLKPEFGAESVRYVLYGAACLGFVPAVLFWMLRPRLHAELDRHT